MLGVVRQTLEKKGKWVRFPLANDKLDQLGRWLSLSKSEKFLYVTLAGDNWDAILIDLESEAGSKIFKLDKVISGNTPFMAEFTTDNKKMITLNAKAIMVYDLTNGTPNLLNTYPIATGMPWSSNAHPQIALLPDNERVAYLEIDGTNINLSVLNITNGDKKSVPTGLMTTTYYRIYSTVLLNNFDVYIATNSSSNSPGVIRLFDCLNSIPVNIPISTSSGTGNENYGTYNNDMSLLYNVGMGAIRNIFRHYTDRDKFEDYPLALDEALGFASCLGVDMSSAGETVAFAGNGVSSGGATAPIMKIYAGVAPVYEKSFVQEKGNFSSNVMNSVCISRKNPSRIYAAGRTDDFIGVTIYEYVT